MNAKNAAIHRNIRPSTLEQVLLADDVTCLLDECDQDIESSTGELYCRFTALELSLAERKINGPNETTSFMDGC